jgi:hypothetical protein
VGPCLFQSDSSCSEIFGFPCQHHSFSSLYSHFVHLGLLLCCLCSDSTIKCSFVSYLLLHTVTFFVAYLHSIHIPLSYYFLLVSVVIRFMGWAAKQMQDILLFSRQSSCDVHTATCSVGIRGPFRGHRVTGVWSWPPPSSTTCKNVWSYTPFTSYVFIAWCLVKHKDHFDLNNTNYLCVNWLLC